MAVWSPNHPARPYAETARRDDPSTDLHELVMRFASGIRAGQMLRIGGEKFAIGSGAGCTLELRSPHVSPIHVFGVHGKQGTLVRSMAADTRVNGRPFDYAWLSNGDCLSIGPVDLEILTGATCSFDDEISLDAALEPIGLGDAPALLNDRDATHGDASPTAGEALTDLAREVRQQMRRIEHDRIRRLLRELRSQRRSRAVDPAAAEFIGPLPPNAVAGPAVPCPMVESSVPATPTPAMVDPIAEHEEQLPSVAITDQELRQLREEYEGELARANTPGVDVESVSTETESRPNTAGGFTSDEPVSEFVSEPTSFDGFSEPIATPQLEQDGMREPSESEVTSHDDSETSSAYKPEVHRLNLLAMMAEFEAESKTGSAEPTDVVSSIDMSMELAETSTTPLEPSAIGPEPFEIQSVHDHESHGTILDDRSIDPVGEFASEGTSEGTNESSLSADQHGEIRGEDSHGPSLDTDEDDPLSRIRASLASLLHEGTTVAPTLEVADVSTLEPTDHSEAETPSAELTDTFAEPASPLSAVVEPEMEDEFPADPRLELATEGLLTEDAATDFSFVDEVAPTELVD
ncbi:MAG: hypothetical protein KDA83_02330, partial [Planctomycetales bacterium]|nr:hypothetical protein [Planctomycetales bacterium]